MKVLCCGDREWRDRAAVRRELLHLGPGTEIVEGECRGADLLCREEAEALGYVVHPHPAEWHLYGRAAGPIRNAQMLRVHPDIRWALAFHANLDMSKGTKDMVERLKRKGIPVKVVKR